MNKKYAQGCWEDTEVDPLKDLQREQIFNDPFWNETQPTKRDWAESLDISSDYPEQYPLMEDMQYT